MKPDTLRRCLTIAAFSVVFCLTAGPAAGAGPRDRTITAEEVDRVFQAIVNGQWKETESLAKEFMGRRSPGQANLIGRLRYIYIFSIAKQIEKKKLAYKDIARKLRAVEGKVIVQPWHSVNSAGTSCLNQICAREGKPHHLYTAQTDGNGTWIYSFEYYDTGGPIDISSYDGQNARLGGTVERIELNRNLEAAMKEGSGVTWYFRLNVKDAFIHFER